MLFAQQSMSIEEYDPKSTLVVPQHPVSRAKYPFIDVHNRQQGSMGPTSWLRSQAETGPLPRHCRAADSG